MRGLVAGVLCVALLPAGAAAAARPRASGAGADRPLVALFPLRPLGVAPATAEALDAALANELSGLGFRLVPRPTALQLLAAAPASCEGDGACLAGLARSAGASRAITGVAASLGEASVLTVRLLEEGAGERARVSERFGPEPSSLAAAARAGAVRLLAPERFVGELEVKVNVAAAEVLLDGEAIGTTPLPAAVTGLAPGPHALRIRRAGFDDFERFVEVTFERRAVIAVDLRDATVTAALTPIPAQPAGGAPAAALVGPAAADSTLGVALLGGAGAAALGAGALAVLLVLRRSDTEARCAQAAACTQAEVHRHNLGQEQLGLGAATLGAVALSAGGGGALILASSPSAAAGSSGAGGAP